MLIDFYLVAKICRMYYLDDLSQSEIADNLRISKSAVSQYSPGDYFFTTIGFAGLSIPNFLFALVLMFMFYKFFDISVTGLFSQEYMDAAWSVGRFIDMLKHLPIPIIVIGTLGLSGLCGGVY